MNTNNESFYRKWIGISQQSTVGPLMLTTDKGNVTIKVAGEVLLEMSREDFDGTTVNQILKLMGNG